ncbi:tRNA uridine-5-carboxymethylaminomethyl(34) synthesis GTPase MnmE, partial [Salmonella enterica subsp. enterica serovar Typhimurium]|nr:tRNA uridine-5-carboxymethylaminomethyl(34) synthesis GTPase MnmE [Salmonella enterica subsp. enterica serovar Typhimurium]
MTDTIFALASGRLPAGIAVVRLSGPCALQVTSGLTRREVRVGRTQLADFRDANGRAIDRGLVLAFKAPHSFTGEDCAEFHLHG